MRNEKITFIFKIILISRILFITSFAQNKFNSENTILATYYVGGGYITPFSIICKDSTTDAPYYFEPSGDFFPNKISYIQFQKELKANKEYFQLLFGSSPISIVELNKIRKQLKQSLFLTIYNGKYLLHSSVRKLPNKEDYKIFEKLYNKYLLPLDSTLTFKSANSYKIDLIDLTMDGNYSIIASVEFTDLNYFLVFKKNKNSYELTLFNKLSSESNEYFIDVLDIDGDKNLEIYSHYEDIDSFKIMKYEKDQWK